MLFVPQVQSELQFITVSKQAIAKEYDIQSKVDGIGQVYRDLTNYLFENNLILITERIFGNLSDSNLILNCRNEIFSEINISSSIHPTFIDGQSPYGEPFSGIHAIAVSAENEDSIQWLEKESTIYGALFKGQDAEYVLLNDVARSCPNRSEPSEQTINGLETAKDILSRINWSYKNVRRTWFYLDSILDWYDEFNLARNGIYRSLGVLNGNPLGNIPASTGIEGKNALGHACTLDLLAVKEQSGKPIKIKQLTNPKQNEATEYGSAFSRAMSIQTTINTYIFISGTASIDEKGKTIHPDDPEKQIRRTFENIASLLAHHQANFKDIVQATAFCKDAKDFELFESIAKEYELNLDTVVQTVADVCRDDLLFEMDATALLDQHL